MSNQQWQQFIQTSVSPKNAGEISPLLDHETMMCDLSHLGLLQIDGADAFNFLQGQVTNDVKLLNGSTAHYTGYCTPKGRMLAIFLAFSHHDHIHLQMPRELIEAVAKRLKMYVMRSKVVIQDVSDSIIKIGVSGPKAAELLNTLFSKVPQNDYELASLENGALLKLPSKHGRFEIFTDINHAQTIWNTLSSLATVADASHWEWLEIHAGIPDVVLATQEEFVPQMLNLDLIGGINFKKGCYTGQEIVARTHYLGSIKRRTYLAHLDHPTQPNPGDNILNAANEAVGKVVRSAVAPNGGYDLLAEIRCENVNNSQLSTGGYALTIQSLPYTL
ncbi:MAG: folate-binding protein YgfZ [Methylotenera sp.]|uniref:CAF17-like 4Fe-4S cluster assembly/insertion protein YgfZ n=1 Tax=Methylotenera sp. TaxID=2051956 RepID=UPI00271FC436|nr:folate-binding protein YgfZ [Methylotenera sp.]MDO9150782.1 folate-binding protein YgfZ [Methylotenera sp.]